MVSSVLGKTAEEILAELQVLSVEYADDPEYQELRSHLPDDWPI
jgi:hypothetical protein